MPTLIPPSARRLHKRTVGGTIHSLFWYLWGVFYFSFGFAGALLSVIFGTGIAVAFLGGLALGLALLIPLLLKRQQFFLSLRVRLLLEIGIIVLGVIVLVIAVEAHSGLHSSTQANDFSLGSVIAIYGLAAAFVAFW